MPGRLEALLRRVPILSQFNDCRDGETRSAGGRTRFIAANADADALRRQLELWRSGIDYELTFWERWHHTKGAEWPDEYQRRLRPDREIMPFVIEGVLATDIAKTKILDVGAGPVSKLGPVWQGQRLAIVAVDPLAPYYEAIVRRHGVDWPIKTRQGFAEDLSAQFAPNSFDAVYCSNALDHCIDPLRAVEEMMIVARVGGRITLEHATNEAENENYEGFHQWNIEVVDRDFFIWNRAGRIHMNPLIEPFGRVETRRREDGRIWATIIKTTEIPIDLARRHRDRLQTQLAAMVAVFAPHLSAAALVTSSPP